MKNTSLIPAWIQYLIWAIVLLILFRSVRDEKPRQNPYSSRSAYTPEREETDRRMAEHAKHGYDPLRGVTFP